MNFVCHFQLFSPDPLSECESSRENSFEFISHRMEQLPALILNHIYLKSQELHFNSQQKETITYFISY